MLFSSRIHHRRTRPPTFGIGPNETQSPDSGNSLGSKLHDQLLTQFSTAKSTTTTTSTTTSTALPPVPLCTTSARTPPPRAATSTSPSTSQEMFFDMKRTLALLELEDDETDEDQHHEQEQEQDFPIVMMMSSKLSDHAPLPSLASSLCSLSEGAREEEEDLDFTQVSDRTSKVGFSTVKVRHYTITIGDHPCCNSGYALSLDWDYETLPEQSLEAYEAGHGQRRNRLELLTSYEERRSRLEDCCCLSGDDGGDTLKRLNRRLERQKCRNRRAVDSFFS